MIGLHCVKAWSKTQAVVAKSSAESELYGVVRGACEGLGLKTLLQDLGCSSDIRLHLDATAAQGILERSGISNTSMSTRSGCKSSVLGTWYRRPTFLVLKIQRT